MEILPSGKCTNRRNQTGLIEGKFLNTIVLLGLSMQLCKFYTLIIFFLPLCVTEKKLNRGQNFLPHVHDKFADQA